MPVSCDPQDLVANSIQFCCITGSTAQAVKLYLLRHIAGLDSMTPQELISASSCFISCTPENAYKAVEAYLLCQIANNSGSGPGTCRNLEGPDANPNGIVTPEFVGQVYVTGSGIWQAGSLLNNSWVEICSPFAGGIIHPGIGAVSINSSGQILTSNLNSVNSCSGNLQFLGNPVATSLAVSSLLTCVNVIISGNPVLNSLDLGTLGIVSGDLTIEDSALASISLTNLTGVTGNTSIDNNSSLVTLDISNLTITDGTTLDFTGNALSVASVELILARGIASGIGACTIDITGGTNAGFAALSVAGQTDYANLLVAGNIVTLNP